MCKKICNIIWSCKLDGLVNGANRIVKDYTKTSSKSFIWIYFENPIIGNNTRL